MSNQFWQRVEEIYHAALGRTPEARTGFLDSACRGDVELRREVESLLQFDRQSLGVLDNPAIELEAKVFAEESTKPAADLPKEIGPYQVLALVGSGGMGDVYLATDRLGRSVALKLLSPRRIVDQLQVARFQQEAQTLLTLNHPNIVTIYDIGEDEGCYYIASELVEGLDLRKYLESVDLGLPAIIEIMIQVATALAAAHEKGIVHRDIKPDNVMIRSDGYVKVLDFGIAKLTRGFGESISKEAPTRPKVQTAEGVVIGTAAYMSPEQARGQVVDARTDIWSCGVMLYEMVARRVPFSGGTAAEVVAYILTREPAPLDRYTKDTSTELQRIVTKALMKNREERYQTIKDMLIDLKALKQELEFEAKMKHSASYEEDTSNESATIASPSRISGYKAKSVRAGAHRSLNAEYLIGQVKQHTRSLAVVSVLLLATLGISYWMFIRRALTAHPPPEIKSLAVLPLRSLDGGENYLGLGIADAVIRRISQTGGLIVRPTSAVRRYLKEDTDALEAARQLNVDAVLDGTVQRADDRLRVSINLLRVSDGASLWANSFDMRMADIFTIQDITSQQVASGLRLQLNAGQQARLTKRSTSNPVAYEFYLKGIYSFDQLMSDSSQEMDATIEFLRKAIEADPTFALAHAQLAYAYAVRAVFFDTTESEWADRAKEEINQAQELDSQLAETHLARFQLMYSQYEGYNGEAAAREAMLAQQLDPNVGHIELGYIYIHLGLEELAEREIRRALDTDPTSERAKAYVTLLYGESARYDEWLEAYHKLYAKSNSVDPDLRNEEAWFVRDEVMWYFMGKGRFEDAQKTLETWEQKVPNDIKLLPKKALLFALRGDFRSAEAEIPKILSRHPVKDPLYHHATYDIACVYALEGRSEEAVNWLRETAAWGLQPYPKFERDAYLNRIRQAPEFIQFMTEMKAQHEKFRREFSEGTT